MTDLPLREGLFHIPESPGDKPYLIGSRCRVCGYACFPGKSVCVRCRRDDTMAEIKLGPYATLETFTVMRVGPHDFPPPYVIGYVRMKEGAPVFTLITDCEPKDDALKLGQEMELVIGKIREDSRGNNVIGWKFKPAERQVT
ncbi:MAG: OB-fold domain-containing protein [Dehalococcoidales bacterium]|nr:OB-fold domain-containing protein [Dehalococcoidales bacterium]